MAPSDVDPMALRTRFEDGHIVDTGRARIWVHDTGGAGEPVFLLGGFTAGHFVFDLVRRHLSAYRLITWEPRGLGPSRSVNDAGVALDADLWAADAADVLQALGVARVKLWATGFGSYIAFALAATRPDAVSALVTYTDVWAGDESKSYARIWAVYRTIVENFGTRGFGARILANVFDVSGVPWFGAWEARNIEEVLRPETVEATVGYGCLHADVRGHLGGVAAPVLVLQGGLGWDGEGAADSADPSLDLLRRRLGTITVATIPDGHPAYVLVQQPKRCAAAVLEFFER